MVRISFLFFILLLTFSLEAQNPITSADINENKYYRAIIDSQTDYLNKLYFQNVDNVDELVNGIDYVPYYYRSDSKPLLFNGTRYESSLILKGRRYSNLLLEYDTYLDEIVYSDNSKYIESKVFKVALNKDPVDGFTFNLGIDSLMFRHFSSERVPDFNLPDGFYEVVYDGECKYIIRHKSYMVEKEGINEYIYSPEDYVLVKNGFLKIKNAKEFFNLFGERSAEVKKFARVNRVHIRQADKYQLSAVLRYYDSLVSSNK
jgi:hypothetical protein